MNWWAHFIQTIQSSRCKFLQTKIFIEKKYYSMRKNGQHRNLLHWILISSRWCTHLQMISLGFAFDANKIFFFFAIFFHSQDLNWRRLKSRWFFLHSFHSIKLLYFMANRNPKCYTMLSEYETNDETKPYSL